MRNCWQMKMASTMSFGMHRRNTIRKKVNKCLMSYEEVLDIRRTLA